MKVLCTALLYLHFRFVLFGAKIIGKIDHRSFIYFETTDFKSGWGCVVIIAVSNFDDSNHPSKHFRSKFEFRVVTFFSTMTSQSLYNEPKVLDGCL